MTAKLQSDLATADVRDSWDEDIDFSLIAGLQYSLERWVLGMRYIYGLSTINEFIATDNQGAEMDRVEESIPILNKLFVQEAVAQFMYEARFSLRIALPYPVLFF
ncbi:MAG: hypothetical protein AAF519_12380 [Bacteroidota bacterium]